MAIHPGINQMDLSHLPSGVYFLHEEDKLHRFIKR